jgi:LuxR family transcriptional regulator, maltose regulon positive regulatory protein
MDQIPVVRTKTQVPIGRRELVPRPHLFQRLDEGLSSRLILLTGPAGFGKTTLLANWVRERRLPAGWLSLDESDNDLTRFLTYLLHALLPLGLDRLAPLVELIRTGQSHSYQAILSTLINTIDEDFSGQCLLVLDDYHLISAQAVHDANAYLLEHLPTNLHLAISSRADPPLPLPRLRARAQLTELRAADLRFSTQEAADFLNRVMKFNLTSEAIHALAERTEGWIAGLQMAAISMQGREDQVGFIQSLTGSNRYILDYLVEEVLQRQSEAIQKFLIQTSILSRFCAPLCDHLLGDLEGEAHLEAHSILQYLEKANLFVFPLDEEHEWYRYHRLFADLLQKRLNQLYPELVPKLHRDASKWFAARGDLEEAIEHALSSGDEQQALALVERVAEPLMMRSEFMTLRRWLSRLPYQQLATSPSLCIFYAWMLFLDNQPVEEVEKLLDLIPPHDELSTIKSYPLRAFIAAFSGQMLLARALTQQALDRLPEDEHFLRSIAYIVLSVSELSDGSLEAGLQASQQASQISDRTGNILASVMILAGLAETYRKQGQLKKVEALYQQALSLSWHLVGKKLPIAGRALIGYGDLLREWNQLEAAEDYLEQGIELIEKWGTLGAYAGYIALARLQQAQANTFQALKTLAKAEQVALKTRVTPLDDWAVAMVQASLRVELGQFELVEQWVKQRGLLEEVDEAGLSAGERYAYAHLRKYELIVLARLRLRQGEPDEVPHLLEKLLPVVEKMPRVGLAIECHNLIALAFQDKGAPDEALRSLEAALALGEPQGYTRLFLDEGEAMHRLLQVALQRGIRSRYAARLLAEFDREKLQKQGQAALPARERERPALGEAEALSEREIEVLHFLRSSLSVSEIAAMLCVAESTVRSHIKSIYSKLGVHRRMEAVERAQALGLFESGQASLNEPLG